MPATLNMLLHQCHANMQVWPHSTEVFKCCRHYIRAEMVNKLEGHCQQNSVAHCSVYDQICTAQTSWRFVTITRDSPVSKFDRQSKRRRGTAHVGFDIAVAAGEFLSSCHLRRASGVGDSKRAQTQRCGSIFCPTACKSANKDSALCCSSPLSGSNRFGEVSPMPHLFLLRSSWPQAYRNPVTGKY